MGPFQVGSVQVRMIQVGLFQMIVEGELSKRIIDILVADLHTKIAALENSPCMVRRL